MEAGRRGAQGALEGARQRAALTAIFTGLGSLSYGEMAGERMKLGLLLNDPEEEHDCFSDNTHNSHYYDVIGIENVYLGRYKRIDGTSVIGRRASPISSRPSRRRSTSACARRWPRPRAHDGAQDSAPRRSRPMIR